MVVIILVNNGYADKFILQHTILSNKLSNNNCVLLINALLVGPIIVNVILEWTTSLDTSSRTLFVREGGRMSVHVTSNVELRNNVRLLLNVELRNYIISRQIVERRVT